MASFRGKLVLLWHIPVLAMLLPLAAFAADGNRLAYLDENDPYYPSRTFPKLITPQWVGEEGVEAVVVLAIDDMRGHEKWETYLRPILDRLKEIDGRAPVSIMTCTIDPKDPHLQKWLKEGLSMEVHTIDHPCPLLSKGDFAAAKSTYERCVDLVASIPGNKPVAFRMPCCDSRNTNSPRFYAELFNRTTDKGNFLQISTSVFNVLTPSDPDLPRELVLDKDGREKFRKYLPFSSFVNTIDDYPYPYVIGGLCWEFPCVTPSDWSAQNLNKPFNPQTVEDLKAALDAVVIKRGVFNLVFHPHGWIRAEQVNELIDHAVKKHGRKVKFLTFREAAERLQQNLLAGNPLRDARGKDNGVRLLDLNADGYQDVVVGRMEQVDNNGTQKHVGITRVWDAEKRDWETSEFPAVCVYRKVNGESRSAGTVFGIIEGHASVLARELTESSSRKANARGAGAAYQFISGTWVERAQLWNDLNRGYGASGVLANTSDNGQDLGVRFRDLDGDGACELIVSNPTQNAVLRRTKSETWERLPFALPQGTSIVDEKGRDAGLRFIDVDEDGHLDVVFSNDECYSLHLFESMEKGWSRVAVTGNRDEAPKSGRGIPPIVSAGMNTGAWIHSRHIWWQNESTDRMPDLVDRRSFNELLANVNPRAKSADASLRSIHVRPGFQVEQVAAEPLVKDPIAFAWGFDGRLWVVEMADYPLGVDGHGKPGGRVRWLEDRDGDGRYDRSTVFLELLDAPTGVMPWRKGVLVTVAPDLLYVEDRDGDGRADHRETLYSGFSPGNPQHRINGLRWGLDNWIYMANGDSGGEVKSIKTGKVVNINNRDVRVRPDTGEIEPVAGQAQFGREQDDWGNWFGNNNSNPLWHYALDARYLARNPHVPTPDGKVHVPSVPGYAPVFPASRTLPRFNDHHTTNRITSACSSIIYRDELFGPEFMGNSFVSEPVHNLIHREVLSPQGVSFTSRRPEDEAKREFLASSDNWFRPTTIRVGPDGALWIADMYRETIEHPEWIPDEWEKRLDLRAGHDRGRIYRVTPIGIAPRKIPRFDELNATQLVALLESAGGTVRDMAQQRLVELADVSIAGELEKLARSSKRATARLHALCTLDGLKQLTAERASLIEACLNDETPAVRRRALRLAEPLLASSPSLERACLRLCEDPDMSVRQQAAYTLGECRGAEAPAALAKLIVENLGDRLICAAAVSSLRGNNVAAVWSEVDRRLRGETGLPTALLEAFVATTVGGDPARGWMSVADRIGQSKDGHYVDWQLAALVALVETLGRKGQSLSEQLDKAPADSMHAKQMRAMLERARDTALDTKADSSARLTAIRLLRTDRDTRNNERLMGLLSRNEPSAIQSAAASILLRARSPDVLLRLFKAWPDLSPFVRRQIVSQVAQRSEWIKLALDAVEQGQIPASDFDADNRWRLFDDAEPALRRRMERLFGAALDRNRQQVVARFKANAREGDDSRGLAVFDKHCARCHRWGDRGVSIGPDLASVTDRLPESMLVAILDPNRAVEARYKSYTATTTEGFSYSGIVTLESDTSITLTLPDGKQHELLRSEIEELTTGGKSLMPEGLENELSEQDIADLLSMLAGAPDAS